ncbi:MAG: sugar phosphate isomerase/epimerase [Marinilabiliales bacterium]|nr:MAG: sugar phosphate isomerase/epimerase [Marinilabiliales bacterium]
MESKNKTNPISRRKFLGGAAALAGLTFFPRGLAYAKGPLPSFSAPQGGVTFGVISYSYRSIPHGARAILDWALYAGLISVELMGGAVEEYAGAPVYDGPAFARGVQMNEQQRNEMMAARQRHAEEMKKWRLSVSMDKFKELRHMYNNAGVNIDITKLGNPNWSDEEIDYAFNVAKTLGSRGITFEIGIDAAKRMAPFAERHNMFAIMHNHGQPGQPGFSFEEHLAFSKNLMLNLDVGHYWGATGQHPNHVIEKFHDRIISLHIKDKTGPDQEPRDANMPFGEGSTPLGDILRLLRDRGWPITADIELEYTIPEGSNAVDEVKKCADHCRGLIA